MSADFRVPKEIILDLIGPSFKGERLSRGNNGEYYLQVEETEFGPIVTTLASRKCALIGLFCAETFSPRARFTLFYVFEKKTALLVLLRPVDRVATSVARLLPSATWFERECRDGFGIEFDGAFDERRLFLHETYPEGFHPLEKSFRNAPITLKESVNPEDEYPFRKVTGGVCTRFR